MGAFLNAISPSDKIEENPPAPFQFGRCLAASSSTSGTIKAERPIGDHSRQIVPVRGLIAALLVWLRLIMP